MNKEKQSSEMDRVFVKWWNEYFKQYQYGTEESEAAKSWAKTGWDACSEYSRRWVVE